MAVNFATKSWLPFGIAASKRCECPNMGTLDIKPMHIMRACCKQEEARYHMKAAVREAVVEMKILKTDIKKDPLHQVSSM